MGGDSNRLICTLHLRTHMLVELTFSLLCKFALLKPTLEDGLGRPPSTPVAGGCAGADFFLQVPPAQPASLRRHSPKGRFDPPPVPRRTPSGLGLQDAGWPMQGNGAQ